MNLYRVKCLLRTQDSKEEKDCFVYAVDSISAGKYAMSFWNNEKGIEAHLIHIRRISIAEGQVFY